MIRSVGGFFVPLAASGGWTFLSLCPPGFRPADWIRCEPCDLRYGVLAPTAPRPTSAQPAPVTHPDEREDQRAPGRARRATERRRIPALTTLDVRFCAGEPVPCTILDTSDGGLGVLLRNRARETAESHRSCCVRRHVALRLRDGANVREVRVALVYLKQAEMALRAGLAYPRDGLGSADIGMLRGALSRAERHATTYFVA